MQQQVLFYVLLWSVAPSSVRGGAVWAAGYNSNGQLGDGTSGTDRLSPVEISSLGE